MQALVQHIENIRAMDWQTLAVICTLCAIASLFIKEYLASPPMIIFVYPLLVLFSVLAQYGFILGELYAPRKLDQWLMWTIMAAIIGTVFGTALVALVSFLRDGPRARG